MDNQLTPNSLFLVSGGAKGITAQCVIALARQYRCKFILLGRSSISQPEPAWAKACLSESDLRRRAIVELNATTNQRAPSAEEPATGQAHKVAKLTPATIDKIIYDILSKREIEQTLQTIRQEGGQAQYLSVDITDGQALRKELASVTHHTIRVTGIIHGAGVLADKPIERKTGHDFDQVYRVKVSGLQNLLACVPTSQLEYLVLFSSVAGFYGNAGQTDYAMANEILNKMAYRLKRDNPACHVVAINWGPWEGGMVTPTLKRLLAERNIELIPMTVGADFFVDQLVAPHRDMVQVVIGSSLLMPSAGQPMWQGAAGPSPLRIQRHLSLAVNPFLADHKIGGQAVLPAACAASWMVNSCEQLTPGYTFFSFHNFKVLKGIIFDDTLPETFMLEMQPTPPADTQPATIHYQVTIFSQTNQGQPRYHYQGEVVLRSQRPSPPVYEAADFEAHLALDGQSLYHQRVLFHGPTFQGVKQVLNLSEERLTMRCRLAEVPVVEQGQFVVRTFNPFVLDVQLQGMLIWCQHFQGQGCLPSQAASFEQFRPLPFEKTVYVSLEVRSHNSSSLVADILAHDDEGHLYTRTQGLEVTMSPRLQAMFKQ